MIGYGVATPLGSTFPETWDRAVIGEAGFGKVTRCVVDSPCNVVGEIPDWNPQVLPFVDAKEAYNWNAAFVILTMAVCREALSHAGLPMNEETAPRTACLIGSAINGADAFRSAMLAFQERGTVKVSPYLLPNLCANIPSGKAGMMLGFTGPIFSPQGACASGNHAMGIGARMIRDGDCDFVLAGGVDMPILPEIIHGFHNMNATIKVVPTDRAYADPGQASRPFSGDRKGFVLSEGGGVLVLAAEEMLRHYGLQARAEILGVGWTSDAYHFTKPNPVTITRGIREAIGDAGLTPADIQYINCHGTSTPKGDLAEVGCLREVFGSLLAKIPLSSNKSQIGHTLGAAAAIEGALTIEGMRRGILLPTINHLPDPSFADIDCVPNEARQQFCELALSNAFGFGGTNCCIVFRGMAA
ncbi:MAG: beta-ketoacyl-[acyl-carrier-protein] synthase family protein [Syntrophaceae bacterium]|nr:beta-ketoacyl-[acyl-carrier-protein] synthase family protein [Syntrophaceae bacterium]